MSGTGSSSCSRARRDLWAKRLTEHGFSDAEDLSRLLQGTCFGSTDHHAMHSQAELRAAAGRTPTPGSAAHPMWTPTVCRLDLGFGSAAAALAHEGRAAVLFRTI